MCDVGEAAELALESIDVGGPGAEAVGMLQEARQVMSEVLESVGGTPYRPGQ